MRRAEKPRTGRSIVRWMRFTLVPVLAAQFAAPLAAQSTGAEEREPLFTSEDLWFASGFVLGTAAMFPFDRYLADRVQDPRAQANDVFRWSSDAVGNVARPGAFVIGGAMAAAGWLSGNELLGDVGLHGTEAVLLADLLTRAIKGVAGRARPAVVAADEPGDFDLGRGIGNQNYQSFPSGHTSAAFAAAALVTAEVEERWPEWKPWVGAAMFGGATLVGLSRMYDNRHWASDVVMGAAIGSFAGWKIVRYTHSHPGTRIGWYIVPAGAAVLAYSSFAGGEEDERADATAALLPNANRGRHPIQFAIGADPGGRPALVLVVPLR